MIQKIFNARSWFVAVTLAAMLPAHAVAQTVLPAIAPAATPHKSAFEGYQAYSDDPMVNWKAANDDVARIGGWREYAKQAQQPENLPAAEAGEVKPKTKP